MEGDFRSKKSFGERIERFWHNSPLPALFGYPLVAAFMGYGLFIFVFGIWGLFNMFENFGLWLIFEYFFKFLAVLLLFFGFWVHLVIGVVYWLVTEWNWEIWQAILFVSPFSFIWLFLLIWLIGTGLAASFSLLGSLFGHKKKGDNGINC